MNENRIREEFADMEIPEMKTGILAAIHRKKPVRLRRKLRPVLAAALLILVLPAAVGAAAGGARMLVNGSKYYFRDKDGNIVRPKGFYTQQAADVLLSEQALANIAPYVFDPSPDQAATVFETASRAEMEAMIDMPLQLPDAIAEMATGYRLWATGVNGDAVSIYIQLQLNGDWSGDALYVFLRGTLPTFLTGDDPEMSEYRLSDGSSASLATGRSIQNRDWLVFSFYTRDGAVYELSLRGENKKELLKNAKEILDTLQ